MIKESTKKTWKGKVAKQWKRMQGSSSAPNTSYPEGGSIGNFFFVKSNIFFCYLFVEKYNLHTHICNAYVHKYVEWPKKIERSTQYYRKKWTIFRDTQIFFFSVAYGIRRYLEISD